MGQALQVAKYDRCAILFRQPIHLLQEGWLEFGSIFVGRNGRSRRSEPTLVDLPAHRSRSLVGRDAEGYTIKPATERIGLADRTGTTCEYQKRRLKSVFDVGSIVQDTAAYTQNHRPVPVDESSKRGPARVIASAREPPKQLPIRQPRNGPRSE
jgi:hypothetical protein